MCADDGLAVEVEAVGLILVFCACCDGGSNAGCTRTQRRGDRCCLVCVCSEGGRNGGNVVGIYCKYRDQGNAGAAVNQLKHAVAWVAHIVRRLEDPAYGVDECDDVVVLVLSVIIFFRVIFSISSLTCALVVARVVKHASAILLVGGCDGCDGC